VTRACPPVYWYSKRLPGNVKPFRRITRTLGKSQAIPATIQDSKPESPLVAVVQQDGKASVDDWPEIRKYLDAGFDIVTFDFRGLGETRMPYKAVSEDDPSFAQLDFDRAYVNPLSSVLADYVYNSLLTSRPYFLQMIEDAEIAVSFSRLKLHALHFSVASDEEGFMLANAIAGTLPAVKQISYLGAPIMKWSDLVVQRREQWPIQYLLPGAAYIH
jgi:hypothetical protein